MDRIYRKDRAGNLYQIYQRNSDKLYRFVSNSDGTAAYIELTTEEEREWREEEAKAKLKLPRVILSVEERLADLEATIAKLNGK